jgi:acyl carrier protein
MASPPLATIEEELKVYVLQSARERGVDVGDLARDDDFVERQVFDSLSLLDFVQHVEQVTSCKIPGEDVVPENFGSLAAITDYLGRRFGLQ